MVQPIGCRLSRRRESSFALFQAAEGYGFSWLFARSNGDYLLLFELGGAAVTLALAIDLIMALTVARKTRDDEDLRNH
jgi:hypothetical protein